MPKAEIEQRVRKAAQILELSDFLDRKPRQLSGGQRQRVAMGRCIVREPKVFLFDEPLSNLDAKLRVQMRMELRNLHESLGITSIYVTHDQVEAMTLGDRLVIMKDGYVEQIGSPLEVYEKPATKFVAGFIGSPAMNFFAARLCDGGKAIELEEGQRVALPEKTVIDRSLKEVTLGIRPEHFRLDTGSGEALLPMAVDHVETLGADSLIHGHYGRNHSFFTFRMPGIRKFPKGTDLHLAISPEHLHLFDVESKKRLGE